MRILHAVPTGNWAGTEAIAFSFANYQSRDNEVTVVVKEGPGFSSAFYKSKLEKCVNLITIPGNITDQKKIDSYVKTHLKNIPDIVHGHLYSGCRVVRGLKTPFNIAIGHMHIRFFAIHFSELDAIIAVSKWQLDDVPPWFNGRVQLIENFLPHDPIKLQIDTTRFKKRFHLAADDYVIGTVARLHIEKGIDTLIKAYVKANLKKSKLVIIGDGPQSEIYKSMYKNRSDIIFTGFLNDAARYMTCFDIYVSASRADSFGLSIIEALNANVPVLASKTFGAKDIFGVSENLFEIDDEVALAEMLTEVNSGRRYVYKNIKFSESRSNSKLIKLYLQLLKSLKHEAVRSI